MKVFCHHLYEYKKGLRSLVLHTTRAEHRPAIVAKLEQNGIAHRIQDLSSGTINVFFGDEVCVRVLERMGVGSLAELTDEEDFVLGIMLGYDRLKQCARYLRRKGREPVEELAG